MATQPEVSKEDVNAAKAARKAAKTALAAAKLVAEKAREDAASKALDEAKKALLEDLDAKLPVNGADHNLELVDRARTKLRKLPPKRAVPIPILCKMLRPCILADSGDDPKRTGLHIEMLQADRMVAPGPGIGRLWGMISEKYTEHGGPMRLPDLKEHFRHDPEVTDALLQIECMGSATTATATAGLETALSVGHDAAYKAAFLAIQNECAEVQNNGCKIGDVWMQGAEAATRLMSAKLQELGIDPADTESEEKGLAHAATTLNEDMAFIASKGRVWHRQGMFLGMDAVKQMSRAGEFWASKKFLGRRRAYLDMTFNPNPEAKIPKDTLNVWDPNKMVRPTGKDVAKFDGLRLFIRLTENLAGGSLDNHRYILHWLANKVQKPHTKAQCALVLRGCPGSGKGLFANICKAIFRDYYVLASQQQMVSNFNAFMYRKLLVVGNEVSSDYRKEKGQAGDTLKGRVIGDDVMIEFKGVDSFQAENFSTWLIFSNHNVPILLEANDRRYSIVTSVRPLADQEDGTPGADPALVEPLLKAIGDPVWVQNLVDWLCGIDLSAFRATTPLQNKDRSEIVTDSMTPMDKWWHDCLPPAGLYPTEVLYRHYCRQMQGAGEVARSQDAFAKGRPMDFQTVVARRGKFTHEPYFFALPARDQYRCIVVPDKGQTPDYCAWQGVDSDDGINKLLVH